MIPVRARCGATLLAHRTPAFPIRLIYQSLFTLARSVSVQRVHERLSCHNNVTVWWYNPCYRRP